VNESVVTYLDGPEERNAEQLIADELLYQKLTEKE
jgi:hypothetical protein